MPPNDQEAVMQHLAEVGPLAVAVYASGWGSYMGGVYDGCSYDSNIALNHAVQLVGYGSDAAEGDYWIVRNSWGTRWGEDGYIRLQAGRGPVRHQLDAYGRDGVCWRARQRRAVRVWAVR